MRAASSEALLVLLDQIDSSGDASIDVTCHFSHQANHNKVIGLLGDLSFMFCWAAGDTSSFSRRRQQSSEMLNQQPDKPTSWQRSQEAAELGLAADRDTFDHDDHHDVSEHQTFDLSRDPEASEGLDWEKHADENRRKRRRYRLIAVMVGVQVSIIVIALIVWTFTGGFSSQELTAFAQPVEVRAGTAHVLCVPTAS